MARRIGAESGCAEVKSKGRRLGGKDTARWGGNAGSSPADPALLRLSRGRLWLMLRRVDRKWSMRGMLLHSEERAALDSRRRDIRQAIKAKANQTRPCGCGGGRVSQRDDSRKQATAAPRSGDEEV